MAGDLTADGQRAETDAQVTTDEAEQRQTADD